jgi:hypothetical protein
MAEGVRLVFLLCAALFLLRSSVPKRPMARRAESPLPSRTALSRSTRRGPISRAETVAVKF